MITKQMAIEECDMINRVRIKINALVEAKIGSVPDRMTEGAMVITFPDYFQERSGDVEYKIVWYTNMIKNIRRVSWVSETLLGCLEQMDHFLDEVYLHPEWFNEQVSK